MSENSKYVLVPNCGRVSAIPADVYEKYVLTGNKLTAANKIIEELNGDVEGQSTDAQIKNIMQELDAYFLWEDNNYNRVK